MRYLAAALTATLLLPVGLRADPAMTSMANHEAEYLQRCNRDTIQDCSTLPDLAGLTPDRATVKAARIACERFDQAMTVFCKAAANLAPESAEVLSAVADAIATRKAMADAVAAAKAP